MTSSHRSLHSLLVDTRMSSKVVVMNATFSTRLEKPKSKGGSPETDKRTFGWLLTLDWGGLEDLGHKQFVACGRAATAERRSVHRFHGGRRTNRQRSGRAGRLQTARLIIILLERGAWATTIRRCIPAIANEPSFCRRQRRLSPWTTTCSFDALRISTRTVWRGSDGRAQCSEFLRMTSQDLW